jgi:bifunctional non-homologous end joining protein LigD
MAKRASAKYQPGIRSKDWLKIKHLQTGSYYIIGYKPYHAGESNENLNAVGSLMLARKTSTSTYQFVGRVGTGFTEKARHELQSTLAPLTVKVPPKGITGLNRAEANHAHWVEPKLMGKVEFAEWTMDDAEAPAARLRHPRWRGLT